MGIALAVFAGLVGLLLAMLAMEVRCEFDVDSTRDEPIEAKVRLFGGLIETTVSGGGDQSDDADDEKARAALEKAGKSGAGEGDAADEPKKRSKKSVGERLRPLRRGWAAIQSGGLAAEALGFLRRLWRALGIRDVRAQVDVGLDDPAATGELWGMVMPLALWARAHDADVNVVPHFEDEVFDVKGAATLRTRPLRVIGVCIGLFVRPRLLRAGWAAVRAS